MSDEIVISSSKVWEWVNRDGNAGVHRDLEARAEAVRDRAKTLVHRSTGALAESIEIVWDRTKKGAIRVKVGSTLPYANVQEFDTVRGKSYLRAALGLAGGKRGAALGGTLEGAVGRRGGGHARFTKKEKAIKRGRRADRASANINRRLAGYGGKP